MMSHPFIKSFTDYLWPSWTLKHGISCSGLWHPVQSNLIYTPLPHFVYHTPYLNLQFSESVMLAHIFKHLHVLHFLPKLLFLISFKWVGFTLVSKESVQMLSPLQHLTWSPLCSVPASNRRCQSYVIPWISPVVSILVIITLNSDHL